jgi:DNA repair protein RecO (recombination protein O)
MHWSDDAIVLATRRHGESSLMVEAMTRLHGRHLGIVKGGRSRAHAATLQPGNSLAVTWRARLDEHLGNFSVEPTALRAADLMASPAALHALQTIAAHLRLLPERDPHPELYEALEAVADHLSDLRLAAELVIRFELMMLSALGVGLDFSVCAMTGATEDLAWVSPRTGRAATRSAGAPHAAVLLPLPGFLLDSRIGASAPSAADLVAGFRLTGHFLDRQVWTPRALEPPVTREALVASLER